MSSAVTAKNHGSHEGVNMATICAVVLTYNRMDLLDSCLHAIVAQTHQCDRIVVIDNASTDGTFGMLAEKWADRVEVYSLPRNIGAAGGFNMGMRIAYRTGADAIWVMDDDVIPEPDALERLIAANRVLTDREISAPFVISTARTPRGHVTNVPDVANRRNALSYQAWPELLEHRMVPVRRATFVSILLPRRTLARFGLPFASMFIWGEDTEFTLRITASQPGYIVGDSRCLHVRQMDGNPDIRTENNPVRVGWHYHYIRNSVYTVRKYAPRRTWMRHMTHKLRQALSLFIQGETSKALIVMRGTLHGLRFKPVLEAADAPFDDEGVRTVAWSDRGASLAMDAPSQAAE